MNCRRIEEMIPLYVGGDLERIRAELVSAHLRSCPACSNVAGQYRDSNEWLRSYRPPEFGSAFFDDLKRGVLDQIELEESRPSFFQAVAASWKRNLLFAAASLLLIIGGLAFYAYQRSLMERTTDNRVVEIPQEDDRKAPELQDQVVPEPAPKPRMAGQHRRPRRTILKETVAGVVEPKQEPPEVFQIKEPVASDVPSQIEENPKIEENPVTRQATTRIEIQTSDPNIRIIWFVPKDAIKLSNRRTTDT